MAGVATFFTGDAAAAFLPPRVFLTGEALTGDSAFLGSGVAAFAGEEVAFLDVLRVALGVAFYKRKIYVNIKMIVKSLKKSCDLPWQGLQP